MPLPLTITVLPTTLRGPSLPADKADPFYLRGPDTRLASVPPPDRLPQTMYRTCFRVAIGGLVHGPCPFGRLIL